MTKKVNNDKNLNTEGVYVKNIWITKMFIKIYMKKLDRNYYS
jgi:hypothetical protein